MAISSSSESLSFKQVARGLVELHRLIQDRKDDSPEAESVRDALDTPLRALNRNERERAQWLSEDLYSVSEPPASNVQKNMNPQAQQGLNDALEARQHREWDQSLKLLRRWSDYISPVLLSYVRGSVWLEAGHPEVATVFYQHASEGDPQNANYKAIYLHALSQSDPDTAAKLAVDILAHDGDYPPVVVARAADIRFHESQTASDAESADIYRELIPVLERNLTRIERDDQVASRASAYSMTLGLLGFCNEFLGDAGAAVAFYSRGLQMNPSNDALLVARGILLYGSGPRAIEDLERAARLNTPMVWPYLFLAHHYLITGQFEHARVMSEAGLSRHGSNTAKSQLQEWRAIAQAELGFPPELVRLVFEAAVRDDPNNELAERNRVVFEASLRSSHANPRREWQQKTEAAVKQFGLAERRYSLAA